MAVGRAVAGHRRMTYRGWRFGGGGYVPWWLPFIKALKIACYLGAHLLIALILIAGIEVVQSLLLRLGDPKLFDQIPLRYIFDVMDLGLLVIFVVLGTVQAFVAFRTD